MKRLLPYLLLIAFSNPSLAEKILTKIAPIADQYTPELVEKICDLEYEDAFAEALSSSGRQRKSRTEYNCTENWRGRINCDEHTRSTSGGFWGGVADTLTKNLVAKNSTRNVKKSCYLRHGYELRSIQKIKKEPSKPYDYLSKDSSWWDSDTCMAMCKLPDGSFSSLTKAECRRKNGRY